MDSKSSAPQQTTPATNERIPGTRPSAPATKKVGINPTAMEGAAGSRPAAAPTKKVVLEKPTGPVPG